jgi:hypothetical protein
MGPTRWWLDEASAALVMLFGGLGFSTHRVPPALFQPASTPGAISYYDTAPKWLAVSAYHYYGARLNDTVCGS